MSGFCNITEGRQRVCKDSAGGIDRLWIFPFEPVAKRFIKVQNNAVGYVLEQFPTTTIYEFHPFGNPTPAQTQGQNEGGKYFDQSIEIKIPGIQNTPEFMRMMSKDYRIIFRDRNGNLRLMGAYNGMYADSLKFETGGSKNSFYGVTVTFKGQELREALFIDNLADVGFTEESGLFLWMDYTPIYLENEVDKLLLMR